MKLFRSGPSPHQTALAMIGAKAGSSVIVIGASDAGLAAEVALVTGLNGRTLVVATSSDAPSRIGAAAANAGALVDIETGTPTSLTAPEGAFDIAVIDLADVASDRDRVVREAARVVRSGGRVVVIDGKKGGGLRKLFSSGGAAPSAQGEDVVALLAGAGLRGTRRLGGADGISYFEGTK